MASILVIPIIIVIIAGLAGYLIYRYALFDFFCKRAVNKTLQRYHIKKTPAEIIKEFHESKGKPVSSKEIESLEKHYRQNEPDQFLAMYDVIMAKNNDEKK